MTQTYIADFFLSDLCSSFSSFHSSIFASLSVGNFVCSFVSKPKKQTILHVALPSSEKCKFLNFSRLNHFLGIFLRIEIIYVCVNRLYFFFFSRSSHSFFFWLHFPLDFIWNHSLEKIGEHICMHAKTIFEKFSEFFYFSWEIVSQRLFPIGESVWEESSKSKKSFFLFGMKNWRMKVIC